VNATLIDQGYTSIAAIANAPLVNFVAAAGETQNGFNPVQIYATAEAQMNFLRNVLVGYRADQANGFGELAIKRPGRPRPDLIPYPCNCKDCDAAVSPIAYLTDLLAYARKRLGSWSDGPNNPPTTLAALNGPSAGSIELRLPSRFTPIAPQFLPNTFHQP